MAKKKNPIVTLDGVTYEAKKPKLGYLRKVAKFEQQNKDADFNEVIDEIEDLVCQAFRDENVTPETLEEHLDLDEIMPLTQTVFGWAMELFQGKMSEVPNRKSPAANK